MVSPVNQLVSFDIEAPRRFPLGEPVPITLTIRNDSPRLVELYVPGRPVAFDIVITASDGSVVWRRMEGRTVAMALQVLELRSYSSIELRDDWTQRNKSGIMVDPGVYHVVGELPIDGRPPLITPSRTIEIVDASRE